MQVNGFAAEHSAIDIEEAIFYERGSVTVSAETDDAEAGSLSVSVAVEQRRYGTTLDPPPLICCLLLFFSRVRARHSAKLDRVPSLIRIPSHIANPELDDCLTKPRS